MMSARRGRHLKKVDEIWLDALIVGERLRKLDETKIAALAESMEAIGLQQPITVWVDEDEGAHLVAGLHRVRAAQRLGWELIDAVVVDFDATDRELWEITENLHRVGLTKQERDHHIRRYAELLKAKEGQAETGAKNQVPQSAAPEIGYKRPPPQKKGIARKIADETGLSDDTVRRALNPTKPKPDHVARDVEVEGVPKEIPENRVPKGAGQPLVWRLEDAVKTFMRENPEVDYEAVCDAIINVYHIVKTDLGARTSKPGEEGGQ